MKKISSIALLLFLFTTACAVNIPVEKTENPAISESTVTLTPSTTSNATGLTKPPTNTPRPVPSLDPNLDNWWNDTVFYEIFVRSFYDSDKDGIGDINGLITKLDYLNDGDPNTKTDLGVTGIWLMPIMESPSYHGYDVENYYQIDQEYGTNEDFTRLIEEAHKRGIKVIIDLVINHTSTNHPWFIASNKGDPEYRDYYIWSETDPSYTGPWGQDVWYSGTAGYYYALFWSGMPDLNLTNPKVTQQIYDITEFWLLEMRADGFRMDAVRHLIEQGKTQENTSATHEWLYNYHQFYRSLSPSAFTVGETWTDTLNASLYAVNENDIPIDFDLSKAYLASAGSGITQSPKYILNTVLQTYPDDQFGIFLTNHDQPRVMSVLKDIEKAKVAAALLLTSPGVPFLYYGEEVGMLGMKPDELIRLPMPWNGDVPGVGFTNGTPWRAALPSSATNNVESMASDPDSLWTYYRDLIDLRNKHSALRHSRTFLVENAPISVLVTLHVNEEEKLLIFVNTSSKPVSIYANSLSMEKSPFSGAWVGKSIFGNSSQIELFGNEKMVLTNTSALEIPARETIVFTLTEE